MQPLSLDRCGMQSLGLDRCAMQPLGLDRCRVQSLCRESVTQSRRLDRRDVLSLWLDRWAMGRLGLPRHHGQVSGGPRVVCYRGECAAHERQQGDAEAATR